jgi:hypothetical protein
MFGFGAWLVERGIADRVYINRMLVGHTHNDVGE